ncbi:hypothetical protein [Nonomuraea typhae]|uniref:WXG100 family type VII secretion target n=1 Tax=Nonomuraea typhae TaxID=2603600 RepID=A0ABW7Z1E5_9ACTN
MSATAVATLGGQAAMAANLSVGNLNWWTSHCDGSYPTSELNTIRADFREASQGWQGSASVVFGNLSNLNNTRLREAMPQVCQSFWQAYDETGDTVRAVNRAFG